ncbi:lysylphosphatidylglycerol synthase domain-containing protein [Halobaculum sp. MBLA0147]|uniref:lysylphosphatidylglycerol synthase domain-containing protein n=1 Tax=Halobaculum sp. MBLA0147 TaxID=3079934 RepID=UPI003523252D
MRRLARFLVGLGVGLAALVVTVQFVGVADVVARARRLAAWALVAVVALVVSEALVDGLGVWASTQPLGSGLDGRDSLRFALAGDFFDTVSPAGPVSSEPIVARFLSVATGTGYADALGVRSTAKYVKSGSQLAVSAALGVLVVATGSVPTGTGTTTAADATASGTNTATATAPSGPSAAVIVGTLVAATVGLILVGIAAVRARGALSRLVVAVLTPVVRRLSGLWRAEPYGRAAVVAAVDRFWGRALVFGERPRLLGTIAVAGVAEQLLTAGALWVALAGTGSTAAYVPLVALVPLPQVASVVPIPGSVGAYDLLLVGAIVAVVAVPASAATAAVLVVRTTALPVAFVVGGVAAATLRGWTPRSADG